MTSSDPVDPANPGAHAYDLLTRALGRRTLLRATGALALTGAAAGAAATPAAASGPPADGAFPILQDHTGRTDGVYVTATPETVRWGLLPNRTARPVARVRPGTVVTIDTVSHEGILEDQGRDPVAYFGDHGVPESSVLRDAVGIAGSDIPHPDTSGPHVVLGPIHVDGAQPGDVLAVHMLSLVPRVPYGVVSNRHGKGALPGELPEQIAGLPETRPYLNAGGNISVFTPVSGTHGDYQGTLPAGGGAARFGLAPFLGLAGVTWDTDIELNSVPPTRAGGNLDVNDLTEGSVLYLPVQVPGAGFFVGDPHFVQGDGEVALTALEGALRATVRLELLRSGRDRMPGGGDTLTAPLAETDEHWMPIGLSVPDGQLNPAGYGTLDGAMKAAVRQALDFLVGEYGMTRAVAYAYLSATTDFVVSQVVDRTKGVHAMIRKADFDR